LKRLLLLLCCSSRAIPLAIVGLSSYATPYHLRTSKRQHALHCATITILGYPFPAVAAATLATKAEGEATIQKKKKKQ